MNQYEDLDGLVAKCVAEEASVLEKEKVNEWMAISDSNREYYSDVERIYKMAGKRTEQDEREVAAAWKKFNERLEDRGEKPFFRRAIISFYSKAAVFIAIAGITFFIYKNINDGKKEVVLSSVSLGVLHDTLPDGTFVSLEPQSTITYSSDFNSRNRNVTLTGEAYFRVHHNRGLPFIIKADDVFIEDISTAFTVKSDPGDSLVTVSVEEGKVLFYSADDPGISLMQNEIGIYSKSLSTFRKKEDLGSAIRSGAMRTLIFENTNLSAVVDTLNKVYDARLVLSCPRLGSLKLTATFTEATVQPIVEVISETLNLSATSTAESILLDSEICKIQLKFPDSLLEE